MTLRQVLAAKLALQHHVTVCFDYQDIVPVVGTTFAFCQQDSFEVAIKRIKRSAL
jgi:hypothetical protein